MAGAGRAGRELHHSLQSSEEGSAAKTLAKGSVRRRAEDHWLKVMGIVGTARENGLRFGNG